MALFALSGGHIVPAQAIELDGAPAREVLGALRERVLDIVDVPLFPVVWEQDGGDANESHLIAMDSAGHTVIVGIRESFAAVDLFEALSTAGRYSSMSRSEIASTYPGGKAAFESAWQAFRESSTASKPAGARMIVVTLRAADDLFPVITTLSEGVRVLEARVYGKDAERYLSVETCHRRTARAAERVASRASADEAAKPGGDATAKSTRSAGSRLANRKPSHAAPAPRAAEPDKRRRRGRRDALLGPSPSGTRAEPAKGTRQIPADPVAPSNATPAKKSGRKQADGSAPAAKNFSASKIPVIPTWKLEDEKDRETPNYAYAMRQQQVTRVRTEQLLWEKSAPRRDNSSGNSESAAASASSDAVKRAAEREILSPAGRLLAIASRNRTPLSLSIEREGGGDPASAKLTAWGTLIVGRASFTDPSQAASEALGGVEVDGWRAWVASDGRSLDDL